MAAIQPADQQNVSSLGADHARPAAPEAVTEPVPVGGLFETHLTVSDLGRSVACYRNVVGPPVALETPERGAAFWMAKSGEAMLGLWSRGSAPMALSLHLALKAALEDVLGACERLRSQGVTPLSFFATETSEPSVIGWMPAAAVCFRDPDGNLLEYLAMLDSPPDSEADVMFRSQWIVREEHLGPDPARGHVERQPSPRSERRAPLAAPATEWHKPLRPARKANTSSSSVERRDEDAAPAPSTLTKLS